MPKALAKKSKPKTESTEVRKPKPPFPKQHLKRPGLESHLKPLPKFESPLYKGAEKLKDKVALITGGDSGIGRAVAVLFAKEGADVGIIHLPGEEKDAQVTIAAVEKEGRKAISISGDVTDPEFCKNSVEKIMRAFGRLDILVNNAAYQNHKEGIEDLSLDQWDKTFKTNIYGYFYMTKAALPHLAKGSVIINTGSITGLEGSEKLLDYAATKGAIHAFTKSLAKNLVSQGIRVNCVAPGPVWTPLNPADIKAEKVVQFGAKTPMKRPAQPEEIAPAYVFLASNLDSSFVSGEVLPILGGDAIAG